MEQVTHVVVAVTGVPPFVVIVDEMSEDVTVSILGMAPILSHSLERTSGAMFDETWNITYNITHNTTYNDGVSMGALKEMCRVTSELYALRLYETEQRVYQAMLTSEHQRALPAPVPPDTQAYWDQMRGNIAMFSTLPLAELQEG